MKDQENKRHGIGIYNYSNQENNFLVNTEANFTSILLPCIIGKMIDSSFIQKDSIQRRDSYSGRSSTNKEYKSNELVV